MAKDMKKSLLVRDAGALAAEQKPSQESVGARGLFVVFLSFVSLVFRDVELAA
jgi:hypothetical protein